ncbi:hypothetical protein QAD02_005496 [Eretmocerus hayati]|uniref:Uncharacterized protein n=1 Tax=Eretmocerus hayati TaxID=131215 RepID=A0ACC2NT08_9HYME|nr:hypothetical protein QAD02_005496 [Eretmocerus hayati]
MVMGLGAPYRALLTLLDALFSALLAGPAVVGYWRGTWNLSTHYIYPSDPGSSSLAGIIFGLSGLFIFNLGQRSIDKLLDPDRHRLFFYLGSRLYTALFGLCCVNAWRGTWQALDLYTEASFGTVFPTTCCSVLALAVMRTLRNISAPPFALSLDHFQGYFHVPTLFRVDNTKDWPLYILDCAFSVGVVGTLVVFVWRGAWVLFDLYLFPDNKERSCIGSLILGYAIVLTTFSLQPAMSWCCAQLKGFIRIVVADCFLLISFIGTVNVWRGIWNLLDLWLLPGEFKLSNFMTHLGCFLFLMLLNCSNSVLVRGVYIDAEEPDGKCIDFPCRYLRLFFQAEREKKESRQRKMTLTSRDLGITELRGDEKDQENGGSALLLGASHDQIKSIIVTAQQQQKLKKPNSGTEHFV